jgi:hypothetical protein
MREMPGTFKLIQSIPVTITCRGVRGRGEEIFGVIIKGVLTKRRCKFL